MSQLRLHKCDNDRGGPYFVSGPHGWVEVDYTMIDSLLPRSNGKRHPNPWWWNEVRYETLERDGWQCRICCAGFHLEVHHRTYIRWGFERVEDLTTLCGRCHELYEINKRIAQRAA